MEFEFKENVLPFEITGIETLLFPVTIGGYSPLNLGTKISCAYHVRALKSHAQRQHSCPHSPTSELCSPGVLS